MGRTRKKNKHLPARMYYRGKSYFFVQSLPEKKQKWHNLGCDYQEAFRRYAELTDENKPVRTMSDLFDAYARECLDGPDCELRERTRRDYRKHLKFLREALGHLIPSEVEPKTIAAYKKERGIDSRTQANHELAVLGNVFDYAIGEGIVKDNPRTKIKRFRTKARKRNVTDDEYLAFRNSVGDFLKAYIDFKCLTALRQGDILRIRKSDLKDDGIHVHVSKGDKDLVITWTDALRDAVRAVRRLKRPVIGMYLFSTRRGTRYSEDGFRSIWQRAMAKALKDGVLMERFTEHDLRAKAATELPLDRAQKLLAHTSEKVTRDYRRAPEVVEPVK